MARKYVKYKNMWAIYSTIADGFVSEFEPLDIDYRDWRVLSIEEAIEGIRLNRSHDDALATILESGIPVEDATLLLYECESRNYVPVIEDGKYKCPNCYEEIELGQKVCSNESCEIEFIWRGMV